MGRAARGGGPRIGGVSNRDEVVEFWDAEIGRWAHGDHNLHPDLSRWLSSYRGRGAGTVDLTVLPEPYIGPLATNRTPALVMLGLNPGAAAPAFQSMTGIYTQRIRNYTSKAIDVEVRRTYPGHVIFRSNLEPTLYDYQTVEFHSSVPAGERKDLLFELVRKQGYLAKQNNVTLDAAEVKP